MKKVPSLVFVIVLLSLFVAAQKIAKPTLSPKPDPPEQRTLIEEGIRLHDQKRYDEAIMKYELVLASNPDSTFALYELAMSQYTKGEKEKAMETAVKGAKYRSPELPLFYMTIANIIDDVGKPNEAVKIYRDAIKFLKGDAELLRHLSSVHYNLAVTYFRQKKFPESRAELKDAVEANQLYPSPHYLLAEMFASARYKIPAILAAARFISLEFNTQRSERAASILYNLVSGGTTKKADGSLTIDLDLSAPTDEGDFGAADLILSISEEVDDKSEKNAAATTAEGKFIGKLESLTSFAGEGDKKLKSTFSGRYYLPFLVEMKKQGHLEAFAHLVLLRTGNQNSENWLNGNVQKANAFLIWAKTYEPPAK